MDGTLVLISLVDTAITLCLGKTSKIFDMLRVFRLVRALRPLRYDHYVFTYNLLCWFSKII